MRAPAGKKRLPSTASILRLVGAAAGAVVVALLVRALGPARVGAELRSVGAGFVWLLVAYLAANALYALPLDLVLPAGARLSLGALVASRLAAVAVNAATPFLGVGGEPVRLLWMAPRDRSHGAAALFLDRAAFLAASSIFLVGGAAVAAIRLPLPRAARAGLLGVALVTLVLALALYLVQRRGGLALFLSRALGLVLRERRERLVESARAIDDRIRALHVEAPGRFLAACAIHLAARCTAALEVYAGARLLGMDVGLAGALVLAAAPLAIDFLFSMIPSQVGVHEGTNALLAAALGFDAAAGVALAFLQRLRQVVFVGLGFALLAAHRARPRGDEDGGEGVVAVDGA